MMERVIIVGTGLAGCQVAISLREKGFAGKISLVGAETVSPYQRPPLSKAFLKGESLASELTIRPASFFAEKDISLLLGSCVTSIDRDRSEIVVSGWGSIPYDRLILATGARNRRLNVPGEDLHGVISLRTMENAIRLRAALDNAARLVIVGAGFIGMEVGAVAAQLGVEVTVIEWSDRALQRAVSRPIAEHLVARHREGGVRFEFNAAVRRFEGQGGAVVQRVCLADGRIFEADAVLVAVGVEPVTELAEKSGLATDNGILVDSDLRTSDPNIFAVGDCANTLHGLYVDRRVRLESVQNANDQARCIATTLTGSTSIYNSVPWFWSDQWDVKLQIAGLSATDHGHIVRGEPQSGRFSVARVKNGMVTAFESVNQAAEHMTARSIFRKCSIVDAEKIGDLNVPLREISGSGG